MIGETVGNFRIVSLLGKGGMGEVWLAENLNSGTRAAIKLLRREVSADTTQVQRLFNEAIAVSRIPHAGIVRISDSGFHAGQAYLVMELLEGETLHDQIQRLGHLSIARLCEIGREIVSVLEATHAAGVTHRDLKPDNVFLISDPESGERVKVLDFGLAKLQGNPAMTTTATTGMGTPLYMSPEQWRSAANVDGRADVYSLGCVIFEMACGRPPFEATSFAEACARHLTEIPPLASDIMTDVPESLDGLVACMLAKHPADRPVLREIATALEAIGRGRRYALVGRVSAAIDAASSTSLVPAGSRFGRKVALGFATLAIGGGAVAYTVSRDTGAPAPTPARAGDAAHGAAEEAALDAVFVSSRAVKRTAGEVPVVATVVDVQVCIDASGHVAALDTPADIAADVAQNVRTVLLTWRYTPYRSAGVAVPACFPARLTPPRTAVVKPPKPAAPRPAKPAKPTKPATPVAAPVDALVVAPPDAAEPLPDRLDVTTIRAAIFRVQQRLTLCASELRDRRELKVSIAINPEGAVSNVVVRPLPDDPLGGCLVTTFESMTLARSVQGGAMNFILAIGENGSGSAADANGGEVP